MPPRNGLSIALVADMLPASMAPQLPLPPTGPTNPPAELPTAQRPIAATFTPAPPPPALGLSQTSAPAATQFSLTLGTNPAVPISTPVQLVLEWPLFPLSQPGDSVDDQACCGEETILGARQELRGIGGFADNKARCGDKIPRGEK